MLRLVRGLLDTIDMADGNRNSARSFSLVEEEFFRAGTIRSEAAESSVEDFADLDEGYRPPSLWRRMFGRKPT